MTSEDAHELLKRCNYEITNIAVVPIDKLLDPQCKIVRVIEKNSMECKDIGK